MLAEDDVDVGLGETLDEDGKVDCRLSLVEVVSVSMSGEVRRDNECQTGLHYSSQQNPVPS